MCSSVVFAVYFLYPSLGRRFGSTASCSLFVPSIERYRYCCAACCGTTTASGRTCTFCYEYRSRYFFCVTSGFGLRRVPLTSPRRVFANQLPLRTAALHRCRCCFVYARSTGKPGYSPRLLYTRRFIPFVWERVITAFFFRIRILVAFFAGNTVQET